MSISDNYVPLRQIGNGVTVAFSGNWNMIASAYARVYLEDAVTGVQTPVTEGAGAAQYTLVFNASGFTVTFNTAPTSAYYVVIGREVAQDQTDPYRTSKGFQGDVVEASFDKLTAITQDLADAVDRSLTFPLGDTTSVILPPAATRANLNLVFDSLGAPTVGAGATATVSPAMIPVVSATTLPLARAAMGAAASGANSDITSLNGITSINGSPLVGFTNKLINGVLSHWDYATSYALTTTAAYGGANRWAAFMATSAAGIWARDQTAGYVASGLRYCGKLGRNAGSALTGAIEIRQALRTENSIALQGGSVVLSFYARAGANFSPTSLQLFVAVYAGAGANESAASMTSWTSLSTVVNTNQAVTTGGVVRYQFTGTVPAGYSQVGVRIGYIPTGTAGADDNVYISGIQLESGSVATKFDDRNDSIEGILCYPYAPVWSGATCPLGSAQAISGTAAQLNLPFLVPAVQAPTGISISAASHVQGLQSTGAATAATGVAFNSSNASGLTQLNITGMSGLTAGNACLIASNSSSFKLIATGCEL